MQIMAINLNCVNVINANDGINANNVHFNLYNTYTLLVFANSQNLHSLNTNITFHMQSACRGIALNPATIIHSPHGVIPPLL
jgi:hypothetical protein